MHASMQVWHIEALSLTGKRTMMASANCNACKIQQDRRIHVMQSGANLPLQPAQLGRVTHLLRHLVQAAAHASRAQSCTCRPSRSCRCP